MKVHITNLYGQSSSSTALKAQNRTARVARETLHFRELGIYCYDISVDTPQMLGSRLDGIIAAVSNGDVVIFQFPTWNDPEFDEALISRLDLYRGLKKIVFVHDMRSLMFESNRYVMGREIALMNRSDLVILPSERMFTFLRGEGLTVEKVVYQRMWDFPVAIDRSVRPRFERVINFAGDPDQEKFKFVKNWSYDAVQMRTTAKSADWAEGKNIHVLGWVQNDTILVNALRCSGGFGLLWSEDTYCSEYMKMNANYKLSMYLAAGLPVIVSSSIAERDTIVRKNLGIAVDSLDEAVERVAAISQAEYDKMVDDVAVFSELIRESYFTKKVLADAVFKVLYD